MTEFTEKQKRSMSDRAKKYNHFRHNLVAEGYLCPITSRVGQWVHSTSSRPGCTENNICSYCATDEETGSGKSLATLNRERANQGK